MEATAQELGRVRVLPPEVADKIAAGEVVERPASVVKELIENSLDAGARQIRIELEDAGIGLIAVVDDGEGMTAADAVRAFARHATSKVTCVDDLFRITTLGFRGEALASIAAVSTATLTTRRPGDLGGTQVLVRGGTVVEARAAGAPAGTRVEVVDLFGNTPARRKFLKTPATEVGHVSELVTRTALAFPHVGFLLRHGTRTLLEYAAVADGAERVAQVYGRERAADAVGPMKGAAASMVRGTGAAIGAAWAGSSTAAGVIGTMRRGAFGRGLCKAMVICAAASSADAGGGVVGGAAAAAGGVCARKRSMTARVIRSCTAPPRRKRTSDFAGCTLTSTSSGSTSTNTTAAG